MDPELVGLVEQAEGALYIRAMGAELVVVAPDRPGLFCQVAGVLSLHGLEIVAADAWPARGGMAVEVFRVQHSLGGQPSWQRFDEDLAQRTLAAFDAHNEARRTQRLDELRRVTAEHVDRARRTDEKR